LSIMTQETSCFNCSFEDRTCHLNVRITRPDDRLNTAELGSKTKDISKIFAAHVEILNFPANLFVEFSEISFIQVERCEMQNVFINHLISTLTIIELPFNNIDRIKNGDFKLAPNLDTLEIKDNKIHTIEEHAFEGLEKLVKLDLSNNLIKKLLPGLFVSQKELESLWLTGNQLETLEETTFNHNQNLDILALDSNSIRMLPENLLQYNTVLNELRLTKNKLSKIPNNLFVNLSNLATVELSYNNIETIKFEHKTFLKNLRLAHTHIQEFNSSGITSLETLYLNNNKFLAINQVNLSGLTTLETLNLQSARVTTQDLLDGLLNGLTVLKSLDLSGNALMTIDLKVLKHCEKLESLLLNNTQLTEIHSIEILMTKFQNLQYLDISENRFNTSVLDSLKILLTNITTVNFFKMNVTEIIKVEPTTPRLLNTNTECLMVESQQFQWLILLLGCLLSVICSFALVKLVIFIKRRNREWFAEARNGRHYLLNDEDIALDTF
jgi:Leucine-rich repeat (LRR) protein